MKNTLLNPFGNSIDNLDLSSDNPILSRIIKLSVLAILFMLSVFTKAVAQKDCTPCAIGRSATMSAPSTRLRPTCDAVNFTATIENGDICDQTVQIDIFFISPDESLNLQDIFDDMVYTGTIPIFSDVIINFNGNSNARVVSFRVNVPANSPSTLTFPFLASAVGKHTPNSSWAVLIYASALDENGAPCFDFRTQDALAGSFFLDWEFPYAIAKGNTSISQLITDEILNASGGLNIVLVPDQNGAFPQMTVDQAYTFGFSGGSSRANILLASGAKINVTGQGNFSLFFCDMFTCSTLARGIEVQTSGTLTVRSSTLNDSRFAIDAKPGANLSVTGTGFFDNYIGLYLNMSSAPEASKRVNILAFSGNTFSTAQTAINAPYPGMTEPVEDRGFCGIALLDYRDFNVFGGNSFSKLANGMYVRYSTLNIGNMAFDDMNSVGTKKYVHEGYGVYLYARGTRPFWAHINELWTNMTFNNCKTGVFATDYAALVGNTRMTNVNLGINWISSRNQEIRLRNNNISARLYGIRSHGNEPFFVNSQIDDNTIAITTTGGGITPVTGIEMQESGESGLGWSVARNNVTMKLGGRGILYRNGSGGILDANNVVNQAQPNNYTGIFTENSMYSTVSRNTVNQNGSAGLGTSQGIYSSGGTSNTFQCNCIDNTNVGMQFYDLSDFTNAVRGNNFNTHTTGLQIGNQGVGDAFIGIQNHTGNLWDLSKIPAGEFGGINWATDLGGLAKSRFDVSGATGASPEHPPVDPPAGWFTLLPGGSFTCSNNCSFPTTPGGAVPPRVPESDVPSGLDAAIANGTLSGNSDMNWKGNYRLYRKMLRHPSIENYAPVYTAFKTAQSTVSSGRLAYIAEERAKLFTLSSADQATDINYRTSIAQQANSLRVLDSLLQADAPVNVAQYNALVQQKASNELNYTSFLEDKVATRLLQIQNLLSLNDAISTPQTCAYNHKTVNSIVLNTLANDDIEISAANLATLTTIAGQCPVAGGDAVYEARAIVEQLTGQIFDDAALCAAGPTQHRNEDGTNEAVNITLYPNPTTGLLQWTGTEGQVVTFQVFDQLGVLVKEQKADNPQVDLSLLPNGLYFVRMTSSDGTLLVDQKVLLMKS